MHQPGDWSVTYELLTRCRSYDVPGDLLFVEDCVLGDGWDRVEFRDGDYDVLQCFNYGADLVADVFGSRSSRKLIWWCVGALSDMPLDLMAKAWCDRSSAAGVWVKRASCVAMEWCLAEGGCRCWNMDVAGDAELRCRCYERKLFAAVPAVWPKAVEVDVSGDPLVHARYLLP